MRLPFEVINDFQILFEIIIHNCNEFEEGYKQTNYLKRIIQECQKFEEFKLYYDMGIIKRDSINKIMPGLIQRFLDIVEMNDLDMISETIFIYVEDQRNDYDAFLVNVLKLIKELSFEYNKRIKLYCNTSDTKEKQIDLYKLKIVSSLSDVVRIFESAIEALIISGDTEVKQITQMFYEERPTKVPLEMKYNADNNKIRKGCKPFNIKKLVNFVKIFCAKSFKGQYEELEEIIEYLRKLKTLLLLYTFM